MAVAAETGPGRLQRALPTFSPLLQSMWLLLKEWRDALNIRTSDWRNLEARDAEVKGVPIGRKILQFDYYAYVGVTDFVETLARHRKRRDEVVDSQSQMWILVTILSYHFINKENERNGCQKCAITINSQDKYSPLYPHRRTILLILPTTVQVLRSVTVKTNPDKIQVRT